MKDPESLSHKQIVLLCVTICLVFITKTASMTWMNSIPEAHPPRGSEGEDSDSPKMFPVPLLRPVRTHLENSKHYQIEGDDEEWSRLLPGDGTVYLNSTWNDGLQVYTVSMYHQLRCLDIIRKKIAEVERRRHQEPDFNAITPATQHCINYLREMVLCRGDLDLDTVAGLPKSEVQFSQYQCWDWEAVYSAVQKNQDEHRDI